MLREDGLDGIFVIGDVVPNSEESFRLAPTGEAVLQQAFLGHFGGRSPKFGSNREISSVNKLQTIFFVCLTF